VGSYCEAEGVTFPTMKRILMAGAPVPGETLEQFTHILPEGDTHTPYGCTECLPVATIAGSEVVSETWERTQAGKGTCVGRPVPGSTVKILQIRDEPIPEWDESLVLPAGEVGEIAVLSEFVTPGYQGLDEATRGAKIRDGERLWHRMGDLGYLDEQGRLWFCGRKAHRVEAPERRYFSVCCEGIANTHEDVFRSALVGVGERPVMVVEPHEGRWPHGSRGEQLAGEVLERLAASEVSAGIDTVLFHPRFPVDIRHNAKIFREELATWAAQELAS
jgi:acyl-CoA synthetase (AMP-forming)/AMP-acid ligase II